MAFNWSVRYWPVDFFVCYFPKVFVLLPIEKNGTYE